MISKDCLPILESRMIMHMPRLFCLLLFLLTSLRLFAETGTDFVGSSHCIACRQQEVDLWRGSHHDLAMAEATDQKVLGDFNDKTLSIAGVTSRFFKRDGNFSCIPTD